jgi:4-amino-4-deoxy-L-arabinose transferase-like glycosyltransferase
MWSFFLGKKLYNVYVGVLSAVVLGTFTTFYSFATHAMLDVPLVFFMLASLCCLIASEESKNALLYGALGGLFFGLAFLTKQFDAVLIPLIMVIYIIVTKRSIRGLFTKRFAAFAAVALLVFAPWLAYMNSRFGANVWSSYFLYSAVSRAVTPLEGHSHSLFYYFNYLATSENLLWVLLLPFAVGLSIYFAVRRSKADLLILIWMAVVLVVFSVAQTKIYYYILPAYPAFALAISSLLYQTAKKAKLSLRKKINR